MGLSKNEQNWLANISGALTRKGYGDFLPYVKSFYGPGGVYDMGASEFQIATATEAYILSGSCPFVGDSVDREHVRDILIEKFGLVFPGDAPGAAHPKGAWG